MAASVACRSAIIFLKLPHLGLLCPSIQTLTQIESVRHARSKHWIPKWKRMRGEKVMKMNLPDFQEDNEMGRDMSQEKIRSKMKEQGLVPPRPWMERSFYIASTGVVFEAYIPPEGDGKLSVVTGGGAKQKLQLLEKKSKSMMSVRKIRSFEEDFDPVVFASTAQDIYVQANTYMAAKDKYKCRELVTEKCYPELMYNVRDKTIHWKFLKSLEPPRVVHARCTHVIQKDNVYGQVTVRFHTQQQLAIYDRFGRLMHGSEILAKDVLEYVVFEKHLANLYGTWRMHAKIIPDWMPPVQPSPHTYVRAEKPVDVGLSKSARDKEAKLLAGPTEDPDGKPLAVA